MHTLLRILLAPAEPFVGHPEHASFLAAAFALLLIFSILRSGKLKPGTHLLTLLTTILWIAFGMNEQRALETRADIRVDLLLFWPPLLVVSFVSAWLGIRSITNGKSQAPNAHIAPESRSFRADLHWSSLFLVACVAASQSAATADDEKRAVLFPAAARVLAWFPADTETLVVASAFRIPEAKELGPGQLGFMEFTQMLPYGDLAALEQGKYLQPLVDKKVAVALRGGRHFQTVSAFGAHRSEGCSVVVFEEGLGETGTAWTDLLRQAPKKCAQSAGAKSSSSLRLWRWNRFSSPSPGKGRTSFC